MNHNFLLKLTKLILIFLPTFVIGQDLRPSWDVYPSTANPGQTISIDINLHNLDAVFANSSRMNYYISTNNFVDGSAVFLGYDITSVPGNDYEDESAFLTIPGTFSCGAYYLLAQADVDNNVAETNESNNVAAVPIQICSSSSNPDLRPSWNTAPANSNPGHTIGITVDVINSGNVSSGGSCRMNYYISTTNVFNANAIYLGYDMVSAIPGSDSEDENAYLVLPSSLAGGSYYLLAYVDVDNDIFEYNESNNVRATPIQIGYTPRVCEIRQQAPYSWDWRDEDYNTHTFGYGAQIIKSPWFSTYTNNENINEFRTQFPKDFEPNEGWELVQHDFGTSVLPVNHPYFILYNRYSGILRFFVAVGTVYEGYDRSEITLEFANSSKRSAILENHTSDTYRNALDRFDNRVGRIDMANDYAGDLPNFWMHADFVMNYDPCLCYNLNQLKFTVRLIDSYNLDFELEGTAIPQTDIDKSGRSDGFGIQGVIKGLTGAIDAGTTAQKNVTKGKDFIQNIFYPNTEASTSTINAIKNLSNFSTVLSQFAAPLAIGKFLVTALSDKDEETKPMAYDIQLKGSGTLTDTDIGMSKIFEVPGSDNLTLVPATTIEYNQPVGVFNLVETPLLNHAKYSFTSGVDWYRYRMDKDLAYTINPLALIDVDASEMKAGYILEYNAGPNNTLANIGVYSSSTTDLFLISRELISSSNGANLYKYTYSTKFVDFACFDRFLLEFATIREAILNPKVYVKVITNLETPATNHTIFMSTYETRLQTHVYIFGDHDYWDEGEGDDPDCNQVLYPADPFQTCNSANYRRLVNREKIIFKYIEEEESHLRTFQESQETEAMAFQTSLFPNPANEQVNISFNMPESSKVNITMTTLAGTTISENLANGNYLAKGSTNLTYGTDHLPSGVYIVTIQTDFGTQHHRLLLTK